MAKTFQLTCALTPEIASERIQKLLSDEGVRFENAESIIHSTSTPIVILGVQPRLYTSRNWVGVNPFGFITGVDVRISAADCVTSVTVQVNRRRSFCWTAAWVLCALLAGRAMPEPAGTVFPLGVALAAWLGIVVFLGGYLVKTEIRNALNN